MAQHYVAATVFALLAGPAFVSARWLAGGRLPLPAGSTGMTAGDKAVLDSRLARLMRMIGLAMLATAAGVALWGDDETRLLALAAVMVLVVNGLALAAVLVVVAAKRRARDRR
ncbi:hypothetical protein LDO26_08040 [Luteimonas sp. BDR2-5]|uniref:hypothetical protein n=1 Tax=Proluteimonas luteida TaxID=2878685 RepID=UPI001E50D362|nr:hypothetical protein [Luteimonas sp. BDR2-5]MCD9028158.1 hypothetical protein [Luteimonas sp. BDR2-5]